MAKVKKKTGGAFADKLRELQAKFGFTEVAPAKSSGGGKDFPLGNGQSAVIESATVSIIKTGDMMFSWIMVGTDEKNSGIKHAENNTIWTTDAKGNDLPAAKVQQKLSFVRADLEAMGVDWEASYNEWIKALDEAPTAALLHIAEAEGVEVLVDVWQKQGSEFINYRVVGLVEGGGASKQTADDDGEYAMDEPASETPLWDEDTIKDMINSDEGQTALCELATANGLDPDEYEWEDLADEVAGILCGAGG